MLDMRTKTDLFAVVGREAYPVRDWKQVSDAYRATLDSLGLGASQAPPCLIFDRDRTCVAYVSYNGKVWPGQTYDPNARPLYVPNY